jgi:hypothetical protein
MQGTTDYDLIILQMGLNYAASGTLD